MRTSPLAISLGMSVAVMACGDASAPVAPALGRALPVPALAVATAAPLNGYGASPAPARGTANPLAESGFRGRSGGARLLPTAHARTRAFPVSGQRDPAIPGPGVFA